MNEGKTSSDDLLSKYSGSHSDVAVEDELKSLKKELGL